MPSLTEFLETQRALEAEASAALPWSFSQCTYSLGPVRQPVFYCQTCVVPHGICAACSIACHGEHEQTELFQKRAFRCDCPTSSLGQACTLHKTLMPPNTENKYNQNYQNKFCRCGLQYIASEERDTMVQCVACEDWFHESCLNLRERPEPRSALPPPPPMDDNDDASSDISDGLPPALLPEDEYDSFVCGACVKKNAVLRRWACSEGVKMVVREKGGPWRVVPEGRKEERENTVDVTTEIDPSPNASTSVADETANPIPSSSVQSQPTDDTTTTLKRPRSHSFDAGQPQPPTKKPRSLCHAPSPSALNQRIFSSEPSSPDSLESAGDIFLTDGWRARWCRCPSCLSDFVGQEYLLEEEDTYEPPEDPDSGLSMEELGMRVLERLPRDKAIDGIHKYNEMRDELIAYLRPFAEAGKEVKEEDITEFFAARKQGRTARLAA